MSEVTIAGRRVGQGQSVTIAGQQLGTGHSVFVVAEIGGNHHRDRAEAEKLIRAAKVAGADAVKTQMFVPSDMTLESDAAPFHLTWQGKRATLWELYSETAMPLEWHGDLKALANSLGMAYFASVFSKLGVALAVLMRLPCLKIASFELTALSLIRAAGRSGLPIMLSTGMANRNEIYEAVAAADEGIAQRVSLPENRLFASPSNLVILKCTSAYPAPISECNLRAIGTPVQWQHSFGWTERGPAPSLDSWRNYPTGLSDHSRSNAVVAAAVALGACVVERHLTLRRKDGGPDAAFSDEPAEFAGMVRTIRDVEAALGTVHYGPTESEMPMLRFRRSLWAVADIKAGEVMTAENVRCLRPADGLAPSEWDRVLGKRAKVDIARATALDWRMIE